MDYRVYKDKIIIQKCDDFDTRAILECGQMFRFYKTEAGYQVITGRHIATIVETEKTVEIRSNCPQAFVDFFDLETDYSAIKAELEKYPILKRAIAYGKGIRIARGDPEEVIFSFIISQNNNIKRIQQIIERLCVLGEDIDNQHKAFPSAKVLAQQDAAFFKSLNAGYRDAYLQSAAKVLAGVDYNELKELSDSELYKWLLSIKGIGPKVASCIMLFGFHRTSSFPVDTWMEKVYRQYFYAGEKTRPQMSEYFQQMFGAMSGIAQQYLFFYQRESADKMGD